VDPGILRGANALINIHREGAPNTKYARGERKVHTRVVYYSTSGRNRSAVSASFCKTYKRAGDSGCLLNASSTP